MKRMLVWLFCICAMLSLCACGGGDISLDVPEAEAQELPTQETTAQPTETPEPQGAELTVTSEFYGLTARAVLPVGAIWEDEDLSVGTDRAVRFAVQTEDGLYYATVSLGVISAYRMEQELAENGGVTGTGLPCVSEEDGLAVFCEPYFDGAAKVRISVEPGKGGTQEGAEAILDELRSTVTVSVSQEKGLQTAEGLHDATDTLIFPGTIEMADDWARLMHVIDDHGLALAAVFKTVGNGTLLFRTRGAVTAEAFEAMTPESGWYECEAAGYPGRVRVYDDMGDLVCEVVVATGDAYPVLALITMERPDAEAMADALYGEKSADTRESMFSVIDGVLSASIINGVYPELPAADDKG